jgi:hypothetical protein
MDEFSESYSAACKKCRGLASLSANPVGIPAAPAHASQTPQIRGDRPLGSPFIGKDTAFGFRDLSLQNGYVFFGFTGRTGGLAYRKPGSFQGLHGITVLFELNPMPGDIAIAVSRHVPAAHRGRLGDFFEWLTIGGAWLTIG